MLEAAEMFLPPYCSTIQWGRGLTFHLLWQSAMICVKFHGFDSNMSFTPSLQTGITISVQLCSHMHTQMWKCFSSDAWSLTNKARRTCNILSLAERRHKPGKRFFQRIIKDKSNVLFYPLPAKRDVQLTTRLRCGRQYPTIYARTNCYKNSFILFGLNHFQRVDFVYAWFFRMFV